MKLAGVEDFFQYIAEPCAVSDLEIDVRKTISIKLEGDQWNGQFDYQVARFLIELQRSYLDVYNLITNSNKNMKSPEPSHQYSGHLKIWTARTRSTQSLA